MTNLKFVALSAALLSSLAAQALTVGTLRTQYLKSPVGVDCASPSFSWQLTSERRGTMQQTYRVELSTDPSMGAIVYDSGTVSSPQSANVQLEGLSLAPATRYYWRVTVADNHGETATASDMFETGLMDTGWSGAQWIRVSDGSQPVTDPGTPAVTDYTIETDFEVQRVAAGLIWGATDHSNYYMWQINTEKEKPMFRPHSWTNGNPQCLEEKVLPMPLANDEVHHLTIEVTDGGTRANTYIDGTLIDSRLGSFPYGQLGFRSAQANVQKSNPEVAWFDDFKVTASDGRTLFADTFDDNGNFGVGHCAYGQLRVDGPDTLQFQNEFTADATVGDYTFEGKFTVDQIAAGIVFAAKDASNFYMWQFNLEGDAPRLRPHRWLNGGGACLENVDLSGICPLEIDKQYSFRIEVTENGKRATTFINNIQVDTRTGDFAYGKIGFRQNHGERQARELERAFFDNLKVTAASGETLFEEDFSDPDNYAFNGGAVVNGRLRQGTTADSYTWAVSGDAESTLRYDIEADITLIKDAASIIFGYKGASNYFMWALNTNDRDYPLVRRHQYANSNDPIFSDTRITAFTKDQLLGHEHHLRLEVSGQKVLTYIDNILVDTYTDASGSLCNGLIGFRVYRGDVDEQAYWDNIRVTVYDAEGTPSVTMQENFEGSDRDFSTAEIVTVDGNHKLYSHSSNGQSIVLQDAATAAPRFRTAFNLPDNVKSARIYSSAMGVYNLYVNGERVGVKEADGTTVYDELMPGWTDYRSSVFYMTHDVTSMLHKGDNAIGALVASGWWGGEVSHGIYGSKGLAFIAKLVVELENGEVLTFVTDTDNWRSSTRGPVISGEIYHGEIFDARKNDNWTAPDYDASMWGAVMVDRQGKGQLMANEGPTVRIQKELVRKPLSYTVYEGITANGSTYGEINTVATTSGNAPIELKKGQTLVVDFGQNASGWCRFKVKGNAGASLTLRYSEILNDSGEADRGNDGPKGSIYTVALRSAKAMGRYTLFGDTDGETYSPTTTFYGFRYCEIVPSDDITLEELVAETVSSDIEETSTISVNNADVNKLYSNIMWGQRSNFLSVPTDCPQRDERLGWTADTQLFSLAASYNSQVQGFYHKWMRDMRDGQLPDGQFPNVAPFCWVEHGSAAWADAGVILPWNVYSMYGDKEIIRENYDAMERYMKWISTRTDGSYKYVGSDDRYGDWVAFENTDRKYVSVCYYGYMADLMSRMSAVLSTSEGDEYDVKAQEYATLFENIKSEFARRYISRGKLRQSSQCSHLLALKFNLLPDEKTAEASREALRTRIVNNGNRLATGFLGTSVINQTLSENGMVDLAYTLLLQHDCPSWLYSVDQGATTIWERWNSYTLEGGISKEIGMNSFNHYAYGAVGEWMYRHMAGIAPDDTHPGFEKMVLKPMFDPQYRITECSATFGSNYGPVKADWNTSKGGKYFYRVTVPANTTATLVLPSAPEGLSLFEGDNIASETEGVSDYTDDGTNVTMTLGSGSYLFGTSDAALGSVARPEAENSDITLTPNPATDMVKVTASAADPVAQVRITSLSGALMAMHEGVDSFSVASLPSAMYMVTVTTESGASRVVKLLKR
jgi:alpha-rhamnosidase